MKKIFIVTLLMPVLAVAQKQIPRIENDTLYTKSGYKMYPGLEMHFGKPSGANGHFRFVNEFEASRAIPVANNIWVIKKVEKIAVSQLENIYVYVEAEGGLSPDGKAKFTRTFKINFDKAIQDMDGIPSEMIVPEEYKISQSISTADELSKLNKLYKDSVLTKDEYESQKKKLLGQ